MNNDSDEEATWLRSSFCASGACLEASRAGRLVLVRDSKQAASTGLIQQWARDEWVDLLHSIDYGYHHVGIDVIGDGTVSFGLHRHEKLTFTDDEWAAFVKGVRTDEFKYELLTTYASTLPGHIAAAAPGPAVPPVPVAANPTMCSCESYDCQGECCGPGQCSCTPADVPPVPVAAQPPVSGPQLVPAERVGEHLWERIGRLASCQRCGVIEGYDGAAEPCRGRVLVELRELMEPAVPVAATPRYILDRDAVMELVERYGQAERDAADSFIRPDRKMAARDEADDLLRAIRAALTPIPAVEPEPAWGSGPLVEHNPEAPVPTTPGTGSADPVECYECETRGVNCIAHRTAEQRRAAGW